MDKVIKEKIEALRKEANDLSNKSLEKLDKANKLLKDFNKQHCRDWSLYKQFEILYNESEEFYQRSIKLYEEAQKLTSLA
jgi:hypothetical protein